MVNELIHDMLVPLVLTILGGSFAGAASVAWWAIKRVVTGQDKIHDRLTEIRNDLSANVHRVGKLETWAEIRERVDDQRHQENSRALVSVWEKLNKLQERKA